MRPFVLVKSVHVLCFRIFHAILTSCVYDACVCVCVCACVCVCVCVCLRVCACMCVLLLFIDIVQRN